ncbi:hypothetical protein E5163_13740 [Marinicauda algicola]|uniref:Uncharacterized protein n=1 Tax=Marinicauda algicola TaxID=2029849 RepID=A0A4S2GYV0_9PROT|nr:hypothetical protein [Marinicauda algicola]TGY87962.1 hypothetical protein E5163_13740 [Marinicauda algicola]
MRFFHRAGLGAAALAGAALSACTTDEAAEPGWLDVRAAEAAAHAPPAHVPLHLLPAAEIIEVRATTRRLMEAGAYVRGRAEEIAERDVDTGAFVRESLQRGTPPEGGSR